MSDKIKSIRAREILDSRGNPTVEVDVELDSGILGRAAVPSGASTGIYEAHELRDNEENRYLGKGVHKAVHNVVESLAPLLIGKDPSDQTEIDRLMNEKDGDPQKKNLGANAILGVSMASCRAAALSQKKTLAEHIATLFGSKEMNLPVPFMNIINGGMHADNTLDFQEFMIAPVKAESFSHALQMGTEVFHQLKKLLKSKGLATSVGDEGGFAPNLRSNEEALTMVREAIDKCGYGANMRLALDVAASSFYEDGKYNLAKSGRGQLSTEQMIELYEKLLSEFPVIISIEDALFEDDWKGWKQLTAHLKNTQLVGDDLFVTQGERLEQGIKERCGNAILIKLNQVGTVSETLETMKIAMKNDYHCMVSHRSGETEDTFIADLAVGTGAGQIKTGSLSRSDRTAKYNQLLRLEENLKLPFKNLA